MAQRSADEHAVQQHLGYAGAEVVAVLAHIVGDVGSEELLRGGEHTGREHLRAQRVGLQLSEVHLYRVVGVSYSI